MPGDGGEFGLEPLGVLRGRAQPQAERLVCPRPGLSARRQLRSSQPGGTTAVAPWRSGVSGCMLSRLVRSVYGRYRARPPCVAVGVTNPPSASAVLDSRGRCTRCSFQQLSREVHPPNLSLVRAGPRLSRPTARGQRRRCWQQARNGPPAPSGAALTRPRYPVTGAPVPTPAGPLPDLRGTRC